MSYTPRTPEQIAEATAAARADADVLRQSFTPEQITALHAFCMKHTYSEGMRAFLARPSKQELRDRRAARQSNNGPVTVTTEAAPAAA
jgi:hypothetical protein